MSLDKNSYLPRQRSRIVVLWNTKAIKIGSLKHSLVEELFTHHHHRSANCWFQRSDLRHNRYASSLYKSVSKKRSMKSTWCLVWIELQLLKDSHMKTLLVKESIPSILCFVEFEHWKEVHADDHRYASVAGSLSQLLKLQQRSLPATYHHHQIHA